MKTIFYLTSNKKKFTVAKNALRDQEVELVQKDIDTPEIQHGEVEMIASYSARWAADTLDTPVVLTDGGFYITALNGFPGPFIKFVNNWLVEQDFLNLMKKKSDRSILVKECLAYCEPHSKPVTFTGEFHGTMAAQAGTASETTPINNLFIPEGYNKPASELPEQDVVQFWSSNPVWKELVQYLNTA